jgi:hypothetical protein
MFQGTEFDFSSGGKEGRQLSSQERQIQVLARELVGDIDPDQSAWLPDSKNLYAVKELETGRYWILKVYDCSDLQSNKQFVRMSGLVDKLLSSSDPSLFHIAGAKKSAATSETGDSAVGVVAQEFGGLLDLEKLLLAGETPSRQDLAKFIQEIGQSLVVAHEVGVDHGDLGWRNFLPNDGQWFPIDWDNSSLVREPNEQGTLKGTPPFFSPGRILEHLKSSEARDWTQDDVYSFAVLIYNLLSDGRPPKSYRHPNEYSQEITEIMEAYEKGETVGWYTPSAKYRPLKNESGGICATLTPAELKAINVILERALKVILPAGELKPGEEKPRGEMKDLAEGVVAILQV